MKKSESQLSLLNFTGANFESLIYLSIGTLGLLIPIINIIMYIIH